MKKLKLVRVSRGNLKPKRGILMYLGQPLFTTLEPCERDNIPKISCIPEGKYICSKTKDRVLSNWKKIPITFEVTDVPHRSGILFHIGNKLEDTEGCILLGQGFSNTDGTPFVINSRVAFENFLELLENDDQFELTISSLREVDCEPEEPTL